MEMITNKPLFKRNEDSKCKFNLFQISPRIMNDCFIIE